MTPRKRPQPRPFDTCGGSGGARQRWGAARSGHCSRAAPRSVLLVALALALSACLARGQAVPPRGLDATAAPSQAAGLVSAPQVLDGSGFHGGLIVHAGCGDAGLLLALSQPPNVLAHALVRTPERLDVVRHQIVSAGLYGRVSAMLWDGAHLPYADGMVNLLVVLDEGFELASDEVERVLAPLGAARIQRGGTLTAYRKPWPADVDEWSHARYDATANAVSQDRRVGPPRFLQWEALPRWNRGVKTSGLVSSQGRIFYILDDSHFASSSRSWSLLARDAHNGILLWRHELPSWGGARGGKKVGPAQMHRRLVASGDRVYATLAEHAPVSVLDAASGTVIRTLEPTGPAEEFLLSDGVLTALVSAGEPVEFWRGPDRRGRLVAVAPATGAVLWTHDAGLVMPMTLAADREQVVYHDGTAIVSLGLRTGAHRWTSSPTGQKIVFRDQSSPDSPGAEKGTIVLAPQFAPTLIVYGEVVAFAGGCQLVVVSARDGRELWRSDYASSNYSVPVDLFGFRGCLWGPDPGMNLWRPLDDNLDVNAFDPRTGAVLKRVKGKYDFRFQHHRCHPMKVVNDMVIAGRAGVEFLDTDTGAVAAHHWTRGSCYFGVLPANGLLYTPPHDCACYVRAKLSGFLAMKSTVPLRAATIPEDARLQRGPAFGQAAADAVEPGPDDWPMHRHDPGRSGRARTRVAPTLLLGWQAQVGGALTSPVIAGNRVFLASSDRHTLHALDAETGAEAWRHTFDARVDSPPAVHQGLVLCGCRDGSVQALRARDGAAVWRFRASPAERLIVAHEQLESAWPVSGSVLVVNRIAYFAAGRSSYLDGGLRLYGLDPHTGRVVVQRELSTRDADGAQLLDVQGVDGFLNDILSSDGERLFMRHQVMDLAGNPRPARVPHLHSPDGFLSSDTTARLLWTYAPLYTSPHQGAFYDQHLSRVLFPSGRILVEDADVIYGFGLNHYGQVNAAKSGGQWALFAADKRSDVPLQLSAVEYRKLALTGTQSVQFRWWKRIPIHVRAMVRTDDVLFVAGPAGDGGMSPAALDGKAGATLLAVAPDDGRVLADMPLPATPVWDGMAAAAGNLYLTLADGQTLCLWPATSGRPGTALARPDAQAALPPLETAPEPGLVGRWRFNEGVGGLARDCSGREHHATVTGRWAATATGAGACLVAAGEPRAAVIPDATHLQFGTDDFTLALWVKVDGRGVRLLGKEGFPENWWVINLLDSGCVELGLGEGGGAGRSVRAATAAPLATGAWNHLVAVADRQTRNVHWYVNGALDSRHAIPEAMTGALHAAGHDIVLPSSHKPFHGLIGDFRIYRATLDAARIRQLFQDEAPRHGRATPGK